MPSTRTLNAAAYTVAANWTGATEPVTGDTALINGSNTGVDVVGGDKGGVDLALLNIGEDFVHQFCTPTTPLTGSAAIIRVAGGIAFNFRCSLNAGSFDVNDCRIAMPDPNSPVQLDSESGDAGEWDLIRLLRGRVVLGGTIQFGATGIVHVGHVANRANDVNLLIDAGADTLPELRLDGGICTAHNPITLGRIAGRHTQKTAAMATAEVLPGGVLNYEHTSGTTIEVLPGGTLNLKTNGGVVKTITNVIEWPGAIIRKDDTLHTFTNHTRLP